MGQGVEAAEDGGAGGGGDVGGVVLAGDVVPVDVARSLFAHAYRVGVRNLPEKQSAVEFTRNQLDRLGIGMEVERIPWGTRNPKLPPSRLTPQQQKK